MVCKGRINSAFSYFVPVLDRQQYCLYMIIVTVDWLWHLLVYRHNLQRKLLAAQGDADEKQMQVSSLICQVIFLLASMVKK